MPINEDIKMDADELIEIKGKLFSNLDELGNLYHKIYRYAEIKNKDRRSLHDIYDRFVELIEEL